MDIKKEKIKDLIRCNLVIPENQRGYDWKEMHADDFWQDIFEIEEENNQQDFYLGSILLLNRNEGVYEVVDGQQRITTIYIFLIALRQFAKTYGFSRIDYGITEYLNSKHYSFIPSPTIQKALSVIIDTKWDGEFNDVVKKQAGQKTVTRICYQNRRIKPVYNFFRKELHQAVNTFQTENEQFGQEERLDQLEDYLLSTLDKVEKILVTRIEIKEVEEAFMLFERLNARGASLSVADLLKNYLFSKEIPDLKEKWERISEDLQNTKGLSIVQMVRYFYMSRHGHITKTQLYRKLKKDCVQPNPRKFVDDLAEFSKFYKDISTIGHNDYEKTKLIINNFNIKLSESSDRHFHVFKSLSGLSRYKILQTVPLLFAYLTKFQELNLDQDDQYKNVITIFFEFLERYHFINNFILSEPTNKVEKIYSNYAALFSKVSTKDQFDRTEYDLINELKRAPLADFVEKFTSLNYESDNKIIKEIFCRIKMVHPVNGECLPKASAMVFALDPSLKQDTWNTEHWLAQSSDQELLAKLDNKEDVHNIGNLLLISSSLNSHIQNIAPTAKVDYVNTNEKAALLVDQNLIDFINEYKEFHANWDSDVINKRAEKLAKACYNIFWRYNYPTRGSKNIQLEVIRSHPLSDNCQRKVSEVLPG